MIYKWLLALTILCLPTAVMASDHYVSPEGGATWGESTKIETPCSLVTANRHVMAGDTVHLLGGEYTSYISPVSGGQSEEKRIVFTAANGDTVSISDTRYAIHLVRKSYITVEGIHFTNCHQFLILQNGHYNNILNCSFDRNKYETTWMGSWVHDSSTYNRITGCTFSRFGWVQDGDDKGAILDIGYDTSTTDATDYNVIEDNIFYFGGHHILHICGKYNITRGNYFHNEPWMDVDEGGGSGNRNAMTIGPMAERNLFENNRFAFAGKPPDDNGANGLVVRSPKNIVRRNMSYANSAGGIAFASMTVSIPTDNHIYFNTVYHNGYDERVDHFWQGGITFGNWGNGTMPGNIVINNIMHDNKNGNSTGGYGDAGPQTIENNWMDEGDPLFRDARVPSDTSDSSMPDFRLQENSPCIDKGIFLTEITSASATGTVFTVDNAGFFFDGWGIPGETGDTVQLEGQTDTAVIVNVDYEGKTITVGTALTWSQGQGLSLTYSGSAPDLGAHEFGEGKVSVDGTKDLPGTPP